MRTLILASGLASITVLSGCVVAPGYPQPPTAAYPGGMEPYGEPPPPLLVYEQPPVPMEGYIWTPGYWGMGSAGYAWVPGAWVQPPAPGLLWTPAYWAAGGRGYVFHPGYWAPHVGYYGGINYGHGYFGNGYVGGRWNNDRFQYNTAVTNVNRTTIRDTYSQTVVDSTNVTNVTRASYVGGPNTRRQPTPEEAAAAREAHRPPTAEQVQHETTARAQPQQVARRDEVRPAEQPPVARQQADLQMRHEQERRVLAQQQDQERANFGNQPDHDQRAYQAMENRHQQQTQQLEQRQRQESDRVSKNGTTGSGVDVTH